MLLSKMFLRSSVIFRTASKHIDLSNPLSFLLSHQKMGQSTYITSMYPTCIRYNFSTSQSFKPNSIQGVGSKTQRQQNGQNSQEKGGAKSDSKFKQFENWLHEIVQRFFGRLKFYATRSYFHLLKWIVISCFPGSAYYFQFLGANELSKMVQNWLKGRKQNLQVSKGKRVEDAIDQKEKKERKSIKQQLAIFQSQQYEYKKKLVPLLQLDDPKLIVFLESFIGNGLGTNLKRLAWQMLQDKQNKEEDKKKIFKKIYYINLREPALYSVSKDQDSSWEEAKDLNYLLSSIIGNQASKKEKGFLQKTRQKIFGPGQKQKEKKSILIIDEAQILEHFLRDKDKKHKLQELYQKISYVQKKKNVRVFMISNNCTFFGRLHRQLQTPNLEDFIYEQIGHMTENDLRNIILTRTKITKFYEDYPDLKKKFQVYFNKIVDYIVMNNNNMRETMRIVKQGKIDLKETYQNYRQSKPTQYSFWEKTSEQRQRELKDQAERQTKRYCKDVFLKDNSNVEHSHYLALKDIRANIIRINNQFLEQKKKSIIDQIDRSAQKSFSGSNGANREDIINSKIAIMMLIFAKTFVDKKDGYKFLASMNNSDALAYDQLNRAQIIHGLKFSSKSYEQAFFQILKQNKQNFKKLLPNSHRGFYRKLQEHQERQKKHEEEVKKIEQTFKNIPETI